MSVDLVDCTASSRKMRTVSDWDKPYDVSSMRSFDPSNDIELSSNASASAKQGPNGTSVRESTLPYVNQLDLGEVIHVPPQAGVTVVPQKKKRTYTDNVQVTRVPHNPQPRLLNEYRTSFRQRQYVTPDHIGDRPTTKSLSQFSEGYISAVASLKSPPVLKSNNVKRAGPHLPVSLAQTTPAPTKGKGKASHTHPLFMGDNEYGVQTISRTHARRRATGIYSHSTRDGPKSSRTHAEMAQSSGGPGGGFAGGGGGAASSRFHVPNKREKVIQKLTLKRLLKEQTMRNGQLELELKVLRKHCHEYLYKEDYVLNLEQQLKQVTEERSSYKAEADRLNGQMLDMDDYAELCAMMKRLESQEENITELKANVGPSSKEYMEQNQECKNLREDLINANEKIASQQETLAKLRSEVQNLTQTAGDPAQDLDFNKYIAQKTARNRWHFLKLLVRCGVFNQLDRLRTQAETLHGVAQFARKSHREAQERSQLFEKKLEAQIMKKQNGRFIN